MAKETVCPVLNCIVGIKTAFADGSMAGLEVPPHDSGSVATGKRLLRILSLVTGREITSIKQAETVIKLLPSEVSPWATVPRFNSNSQFWNEGEMRCIRLYLALVQKALANDCPKNVVIEAMTFGIQMVLVKCSIVEDGQLKYDASKIAEYLLELASEGAAERASELAKEPVCEVFGPIIEALGISSIKYEGSRLDSEEELKSRQLRFIMAVNDKFGNPVTIVDVVSMREALTELPKAARAALYKGEIDKGTALRGLEKAIKCYMGLSWLKHGVRGRAEKMSQALAESVPPDLLQTFLEGESNVA